MKAAVVVFPGSNCDRDVKVALRRSLGREPDMVWHRDATLPATDLIVLPGGFSYGDYLRCGAVAARSPVMRDVVEQARRGTPLLAICNGFQVACEAGLLPGVLMANAKLKFVCADVHLKVENVQTPFTQGYDEDQVVRLPVAHHDGMYVADGETLRRLEDENRIVFRYCDRRGEAADEANPNGSQHDIAGIVNQSGTVLGMMPHPERLADPALGGADGRVLFESLVGALG